MTKDTQTSSFFPIQPTIAVGLGAWLLYFALTFAIQSSAGVAYADWFKTADNAWRTAVLSLAAGSLLLVIITRLAP